MEVEWQTCSRTKQPGDYLWKKRPKLGRAGRIVRWTLVGHVLWKPDESRTSGRRAKARLTNEGFTDPDLPNILRHLPVKVL